MITTGPSETTPFFPKPEFVPPPSPKKSKVVRKAAFVFFVANALPFLGAYWYLNSAVKANDQRKKTFHEYFISSDSAFASNKTQELCSFPSSVLLISPSSVKAVRPQPPETQPLVFPDKFPLSFYQYDPLVDVIAAHRVDEAVPLDFIHFAVPEADPCLGTTSLMRLVYLNNEATITISGKPEIVEDERRRDFYWRRVWGPQTGERVLVKFTPLEISVQSNSTAESRVLKRSSSRGPWL